MLILMKRTSVYVMFRQVRILVVRPQMQQISFKWLCQIQSSANHLIYRSDLFESEFRTQSHRKVLIPIDPLRSLIVYPFFYPDTTLKPILAKL